MTLDLTKLRQLITEDGHFFDVIHVLAKSRARESITSARLIASRLEHRSGNRIAHETVIGVFRLLEDAGAGRTLDGGRRDRARFQWAIRPQALAASVLNPAIGIVPSDFLDPSAMPVPAAPVAALAEGWERFRLTLRPGMEVVVDLPRDLTDREAQRLGHLLRAAAQTP